MDFFKDQLSTASREQPEATGGAEVLEKAYHAAMALATVPIPSKEKSSPRVQTLITNATDVRPQFQTVTSNENASESEVSREEMAIGKSGSSTKPQVREDVGEVTGSVEGRDGARAVDAEGLIWLDDTQRTAYSVRYAIKVEPERVSTPYKLLLLWCAVCVVACRPLCSV